MRRLPPRDVGDGRDDLPRQSSSAHQLVAAIWYVVNQKNGVSALELQHVLEWPELHDEAMRDIGLALKAPTVAAAGSAPAGRDRLHVDPAKLRAAILAPCASA